MFLGCVLLLCVLHVCGGTPDPDREMCYSRQHRDAAVNTRVALDQKGTVMVARAKLSEKDCILTCCSEDIGSGLKCNLVVYEPGDLSCQLFHCPSERECPLMTASAGVNTYNIFKGITHPTTKGRVTAKPTTTSTSTTTKPAPTTTTSSSSSAEPTESESPMMLETVAMTTAPTTTATSTTQPTSTSTTKSTSTTQPTSTSTTKSTSTTQPTSTSTTKSTSTTQPTSTSKTKSTSTTQPTSTSTTKSTSTTQPTSTSTTKSTSTKVPHPPPRTPIKPNRPKKPSKPSRPETHSLKPTRVPTAPPTSRTPSTTTATTTAALLELESGPVLSRPGKPKVSRVMWKNSLLAIVVTTLVFLALILSLAARKAMESFDRRHYTRLELNELHYEL